MTVYCTLLPCLLGGDNFASARLNKSPIGLLIQICRHLLADEIICEQMIARMLSAGRISPSRLRTCCARFAWLPLCLHGSHFNDHHEIEDSIAVNESCKIHDRICR